MAGDYFDAPNQEVVRGGAATPEPEPADVEGSAGFDPGAHTVDEVKAYVEAHPEEAGAVADAEAAGKARATLLDWLAG